MMIEATVVKIKYLQRKIKNTLVLEKAAEYQAEIDELIDEANRLSIDINEYLEDYDDE